MSETPVQWLTPEELSAWRNVSLMEFQLTAAIGRDLAQHGLSYQDYLVLVVLSEAENQAARAHEIGSGLGWEKSRLSHHLKRMEKRGLVRRTNCPTDGRGIVVRLTDAGMAALVAAAPTHVGTVRRFFVDVATAEELAVIDRLAQRVLGMVDTADDIPR